MANLETTAGGRRKLKRLVPEVGSDTTEILLQVRLWSGAKRDEAAPLAAIAMVNDLLTVSQCVSQSRTPGAIDAEFAEPLQAVKSARRLQRMIRGYAETPPMCFLDGCITLSKADEDVPALDIAQLSLTEVVTPAQPCQIFMVGSVCEEARSIPGLRFRALSAGFVEANRQGRPREVLHLLPAAGVDDPPIEIIPEVVQSELSGGEMTPSSRLEAAGSVSVFTRSVPAIHRDSRLRWVVVAAGIAAMLFVLFSDFRHRHVAPSMQAALASVPGIVIAQTQVIPAVAAEDMPLSSKPLSGVAASRRKEKNVFRKTPPAVAASDAKAERDELKIGALGFSSAEISSLVAKANQDADDGRYDRAIFEYQTILKSKPGNVQAREGLARAIRNKGSE